jgi:hypothetical protein
MIGASSQPKRYSQFRMSSLFQDLMTGLDEVDAYLANRQPEQSAPTQDPLLSFRSAAEESASPQRHPAPRADSSESTFLLLTGLLHRSVS